ncbi:ethanolamine ammonia-lyase reactivating factor EutA [Rugosimonospora acidiphila]|uniref:Ethanolamine ammonia-lyase reactivating factor EutA n=1 Tax=Rugosimonospora acidiphila TaxID=556531 RepID=A0ABP9SQC3_9ACTN
MERLTEIGDGEADSPYYWRDNVAIVSVGIDIGSSTSHLSFSRLKLRRELLGLSSRFVVVERVLLWASDITLTPYTREGELIDAAAIGAFVADCYTHAGLARTDVDTGVVILTGQALKRENSRAIADAVSARAGDFVCVAAGDHFEAVLSAYGSGAVELSKQTGEGVLCVDIGGGTTKFSLSRAGEVVRTGILSVGARLVSWDVERRVVTAVAGELDAWWPAAQRPVAGKPIGADQERALAAAAVDAILAAATGRVGTLDPAVVIPGSDFREMDAARLVTFSGGVAEYVFDRQDGDFGDLGRAIGQRVRQRLGAALPGARLAVTGGGIRATVAGASQYSVQVSGNTVSASAAVDLPLRNVPVLHPRIPVRTTSPGDVAGAVMAELELRDGDAAGAVALSLRIGDLPAYPRLRALAEGVATGLDRFGLAAGAPVVVLTDKDVGRSIGRILFVELGVRRPIVCLDSLVLEELDFVDIGRQLLPAGVYPVVVKSLLFSPRVSTVAA